MDIYNYWKWVVGGGSAIGAIAVFSLNFAKLVRENKKLKRELVAQEFDLESKSLAHAVLILVDYQKQRAGTHDLVFDEARLRQFLGSDADMVYGVIDVLRSKGNLQDTETPGIWKISL